jgi:multicomponent Na+:H+ antiporter subunit D
MSELGLYAVVRIWWTCFSGALGDHEEALRTILLVAGTVTALVPAVLCLAQTHLKRMLAYATVSYIGLFLLGVALLSPDGLAGTAVFLVADGFVKASLFVCVGIVQHRRGRVDEYRLRGQGRDLPYTGALFALGGLLLASLPPFGTFLGKSLIEDAAVNEGYDWLIVVFVLASALTGGAVLRAAGRVFLGLGSPGESDPTFELDEETDTETGEDERHDVTPAVLFVPAALLLAGALVLGLIPGVAQAALRAATVLVDRAAYVAAVLQGAAGTAPHVAAPEPPRAPDFLYGTVSTLGALAVAGVALFHERLPRVAPRRVARGGGALIWRMRRLHSGHVGDYIAWVTAGVALFGGAFALTLL